MYHKWYQQKNNKKNNKNEKIISQIVRISAGCVTKVVTGCLNMTKVAICTEWDCKDFMYVLNYGTLSSKPHGKYGKCQ